MVCEQCFLTIATFNSMILIIIFIEILESR